MSPLVTKRAIKDDSEIERACRYEQNVIGALMESPALSSQIGELNSSHFVSGFNRVIFTAIGKIIAKGEIPDLGTVDAEVGSTVPPDYVNKCRDGVLPECFRQYKRAVLEAAKDRQYKGKLEALGTLSDPQEQIALLREMQAIRESNGEDSDWRSMFHSREEFDSAPPLEFRINGFLQADGITLIGGLSGHSKTLLMMAMGKSLLEGSPLFGYDRFTVETPVKRVVYLVPESALGPFEARIKLFRLEQFRGNGLTDQLFVHTLSKGEPISLSDPRLLKAAEGADVFLDTAVRFMDGSENDVEGTRPFADLLFRLLNAGARSICGAHHSPKSFSNAEYMSLENILRGSGDIGAMLCTAWGVRQIDAERNRVWIENCKPRDFQPCQPFILEGRPHIDETGNFQMIAAPGNAGELKDHMKRTGRPESLDKADKLIQCVEMRAAGNSLRKIQERVGVPRSTVERWLFDYDSKNGKAVTQ
jgi:AAA domain/DnaB-like helicase N terminal domain